MIDTRLKHAQERERALVKSLVSRRHWLRMSQSDVADASEGHLTRAVLANIESGRRPIDLITLMVLCDVLDMDVLRTRDRRPAFVNMNAIDVFTKIRGLERQLLPIDYQDDALAAISAARAADLFDDAAMAWETLLRSELANRLNQVRDGLGEVTYGDLLTPSSAPGSIQELLSRVRIALRGGDVAHDAPSVETRAGVAAPTTEVEDTVGVPSDAAGSVVEHPAASESGSRA